MKIGKRKAASLLALAVFGVLGTSATANASTGADGFPILHASTHQFAHQCIVIGSDSQGDQGVMCASLRNEWESSWFGWDTTAGCDSNPNSSYDVWTVIEGGSDSGIELPGSDKWVYLVNGNDGLGESSGHNYVCW